MPRGTTDCKPVAKSEWAAFAALFLTVIGSHWRLSLNVEHRFTALETKMDSAVIPRLEALESARPHAAARPIGQARTVEAENLKGQ